MNGEVDRIILSRPAVEAGERLGFLPGDMKEKVDPYLRPLYDALSVLEGVSGIGVTAFQTADIVRHAMVGRIVAAYDKKGAANSRKVRG